ncbi:ABC transporter permease [Gorillibacterium timonense]|uniref:ABC transporter permease n=1 Tax=Gorillibacterium timonense TaxID=1689269 RepID=UPI00071D28D7|nr:ABC transporter permease [Gorillibacterium timonense]
MKRRWLAHLNAYGYFLLLAALLLALWEAFAHMGWMPPFTPPAPTAIGRALLANSQLLLLTHLPVTLREVGAGFLLSVAGGLLLAAGMRAWRPLDKALYPLIVISQTLPLITLAPVFILWFGYSLLSKVAVVVLTAFFPVVVGAYDGLAQGSREYRELLQAMGASRREIFFKVRVPFALPSFFSGLKLAAVYSVVGATIGEWLGGNAGLGYYSRRMSANLQTAEMFAAVLLLSVTGILCFLVIILVEKLCCKRRKPL